MDSTFKNKLLIAFFIAVFLVFVWEIYIPNSLSKKSEAVYVLQKGWGYKNVSSDLKKQGIIKNAKFFDLYVLVFGNYKRLQAGSYNLSPSMSIADIVKKFTEGDVVKNTIIIIEGWDLQDIGALFGDKNILAQDLEGYIFPDTYELSQNGGADELIQKALANFDKKLTLDLRSEIASQKKSIPQIIAMASMIEKEVITLEDKKIVSGILWKRIQEGMPLQVDATINYITQKSGFSITVKDKKTDSPYNTYKYYGLPKGPICNPGMDSILAAIYPEKSDYWYYLSVPKTGQTIFSKTLEEHNIAIAKYLNY